MNFNEISGKMITYDDIKSDKKQSFTLLQTAYFFKHILRSKARIFSNETFQY